MLVEALAANVTPVRRLWPVSVRLGLWLLLEAIVLMWVATHTGNDFMRKLGHLDYALEVMFFAAAAMLAAMMALRVAIPGRSAGARQVAVAVVLVLIGTALVVVDEPARTGYPLGEFFRVGIGCAVQTCVLAGLPWLALWWAVKRGAPMRGAAAGASTGAAALLFSFALMRIGCPIDEPLHIVTWHLLPALGMTALSALAGAVWLRFRPRARPARTRPADARPV